MNIIRKFKLFHCPREGKRQVNVLGLRLRIVFQQHIHACQNLHREEYSPAFEEYLFPFRRISRGFALFFT